MGLDISALSKIDFTKRYTEDADIDNEIYLYPEKWVALQNEGIEEGRYSFSGDHHRFRAGSYGGYNYWRKMLAEMVGKTPEQIWEKPEEHKGTPFFELINFSDCEGFIGPKTSAKLYQDFVDHDEQADEFSKTMGEEGAWSFKDKYDNWKEAFKVASEGGAVIFC